jgi:hypothetical protein
VTRLEQRTHLGRKAPGLVPLLSFTLKTAANISFIHETKRLSAINTHIKPTAISKIVEENCV